MEIFNKFGLKTEIEQDPPFEYLIAYKRDREWGPQIRVALHENSMKVVMGKIVGNPIEVLERFAGFVRFATMKSEPYCFGNACEYGRVIVFNPQLLRTGSTVKITIFRGMYRSPACGGIHCEERALVLVVEEAAITDNKNEIEFTITRCEEQEGVVAAISHVLHYYNRYSENPHICRQFNLIYKKSSQ